MPVTVMSSKQRLLAAIARRQPDRVPVAPRMSLWSVEQYGDYNWLRILKLQEEFGFDPLVDVNFRVPAYFWDPFSGDYRDLDDVSVDLTVENKGDLNRVRRVIHTPAGDLTDVIDLAHRRSQYGLSPSPAHREPLVKGLADVDRVRFLFSDPRKVTGTNWPDMMEIIGDRGLLQVHPAPGLGVAMMAKAMGMENAMVGYYQSRDLFDRLLELFAEYHHKLTVRILELGAPLVFASWHDFGVSAGWSPKIWREVFKPVIEENVELVHSYGALYHYYDPGTIVPLLPDLGELGVDIVSSLCPPPVGDVDLREAKDLIGDGVCLMGNVDVIWVVQRGTPAQVREAVREAIRAAAPGGGFILSNSGSFVPQTPRQNVEAFFEAAREFGGYPIR